MIVQGDNQLNQYRKVCDLSVEIMEQLHQAVQAGMLPTEIDKLANGLCNKNGARPAFKSVPEYHHATCIYVNDVVVHGIPSSKRKFQANDIVKVDFGLIKDNFFTDHCFSIGISPVDDERMNLIQVGKEAVLAGVDKAIIGNHIGDIGHTIETIARKNNYQVITEYVGHSIGRKLHEPPNVPGFGHPGTGSSLKQGMILCIEAQIVSGSNRIYAENDGWTIKTADGSLAVMFEYMVMVQEKEPLILTDTRKLSLTTKS